MTHDQLVGIFEEWMRRYQENPTGFMDDAQAKSLPTSIYGEVAATYFELLVDELTADGVK